MKSKFLIYFFNLWAKTGKALGLLYSAIDRESSILSKYTLRRRVLGGVDIDCSLADHIQRRIYFFGAYEPIEAYLLSQIIQPESVIFDAGANIGFYSLAFSQYAKQGEVYAFEPVPKNFEKLKHNISLNPKIKNIHVVQMGLWNETATLTFSLDDDMKDNVGSFTAGRVQSAGQSVSSPVMRMDEFVEKNKITRLDLIKMDIAGAELYALHGAEQTLRGLKPSLMVEINKKACESFQYSPDEIYRYLKQFGYSFYRVGYDAANSAWIESFDGIDQANVLVLNEKHRQMLKTDWQPNPIKKRFIDGLS